MNSYDGAEIENGFFVCQASDSSYLITIRRILQLKFKFVCYYLVSYPSLDIFNNNLVNVVELRVEMKLGLSVMEINPYILGIIHEGSHCNAWRDRNPSGNHDFLHG